MKGTPSKSFILPIKSIKQFCISVLVKHVTRHFFTSLFGWLEHIFLYFCFIAVCA